MKKLSPIQEAEEAIGRQRAIISHRVHVKRSFDERLASLVAERDAVQVRIDRLHADYESADEAIAEAERRIREQEAAISQLRLRGSASSKPKLSPRERKIAKLKKALAAVQALSEELGEEVEL